MNRVTRRLTGRDTGWAGPGVLGMLTLGAFALVSIAVTAPGGPVRTAKVAHLASVQLADDDGGQAMFSAQAMAPGRALSRCLKVGYTGSAGQSGDVRLAATDITGALATSLNVTAAVGTGGGFASCAGFSGTTFYTGPLSGLTGATPPGTATGWSPTGTDSRTFQITVMLADDNTLQGAATRGTLQWVLVGDPAPDPTTPAAPDPTTPAAPAPTTPAAPAPVDPAPTGAAPAPVAVDPVPAATDTPASSPSASPPVTPGATPSARTAFGQAPGDVSAAGSGRSNGSPGGGSAAAGKSTWSGLTTIASNLAPAQLAKNIQSVAKDSMKVAKRVAKKHTGLPAMSVVALGSFLVLQGRIDRKDPKLALAPLWGDGDLPFEDPDLAFADPDEIDYKPAEEDEDR